MIPLLAPLFEGEWAAFGDGLSCAPAPPGAVRLDRLLADPQGIPALLGAHGRHLGCEDMRPVSVAWLLDYCWTLLPAFIAAATLLQQRLPLAPSLCWLALDADGHPVRLHLLDDGIALPGTEPAARYGELLRTHLPPLVAALARHGRVAERLLWGNVARRMEAVFEQVLPAAGEAGRIDAEALLGSACWPDGSPNPLHGRMRSISRDAGGRATRVVLHRECCLCYLLPEEDYCAACPLAPANRSVRKAAGAKHPARPSVQQGSTTT